MRMVAHAHPPWPCTSCQDMVEAGWLSLSDGVFQSLCTASGAELSSPAQNKVPQGQHSWGPLQGHHHPHPGLSGQGYFQA